MMHRLSRSLPTAVGVLAALVFIAASCAMNSEFWYGQGRSAHEGYILGAVSIAADILKAVLPLYIVGSLGSWRLLYAALASAVFVVFLASSLISSVGFIAVNRGEHTGSRETLNARLSLAQSKITDLDGRLARIRGYPPVASIEANLKALQQDKRWATSKGCEDAT